MVQNLKEIEVRVSRLYELLDELVARFKLKVKKKEAKTLHFVIYEGQKRIAEGEYVMITLNVGESKNFVIVGKTAGGKVASLDTHDVAPVYVNSNPGAVDLLLNPDKLSGKITALSAGPATIHCDVDADLDAGQTRIISAVLDVTVKAEEAVTAEFVVT